MFAPLRNPCLNFCILLLLCTAPAVFRCQAYPLGGDDLSISGRSDTTHSVLGARDRPLGYSSNPDKATHIVLNAEDEEDNDDALQFGFQVESVSDVDEEAGTAKLNGSKDVLLKEHPRELGENDAEGLSRKYYIVDPNHASNGLESQAVLKIVDLLKAEKFGQDVPDYLTIEGWYWAQGEGLMLLWESNEPVEKKDSHGKVVKRDHIVIYRSTRRGVPLQDENGDMHWTKLKFIAEWVAEWNSAGQMEDMLARCKESAMKTHKRLAKKEMQINDYDLNKWVTDENCSYWLPNEINVAFDADDEARKVSVKGGDSLESVEQESYLKKVKEQLDQQFTPESIETHREKLLEIPAQA